MAPTDSAVGTIYACRERAAQTSGSSSWSATRRRTPVASLITLLALIASEGCSVYHASLLLPAPPDDDAGGFDADDAQVAVDATVSVDDVVDATPNIDTDVAADASEDADGDDATASAEDADAPSARPASVIWGSAASPSGQQVPSMKGNIFTQACSQNEVVIGYTGTINAPDGGVPALRSFRAVCASLSVLSVGGTFAVKTAMTETLTAIGSAPGPVAQLVMCQSDEMVVGFSGRSGSDIDQIAISCAPLVISGVPPILSIGSPTIRPGLGGQGGAPFDAISCPAGQVATGDEGRAASTINTFGLLCTTPMLVVE